MALTSSMWTGVSGLLAHGEKMNVIGNNIANVSTVGFRGQRMDFADFVYQNTFTSNGLAQIGRGVKIGAIMQNFSAGSYESTTEATDLSINGRGFFKVNKIGTDQAYYTRAGNFRFNNEGYLADPNGLALQGWKVDNSGGVKQAAGGMNVDSIAENKKSTIVGTGVPQDVRLDTWTVNPQQTTNIIFKVNLPNDTTDKSTSQTNPFAALLEKWDGTQPPPSASTKPMPETAYDNATTLEVYDEAGSKHKITIYYDKVDKNSYEGGSSSEEIWEYTVTMEPSEDQRMYWDQTTSSLRPLTETKMAGMLMTGTMTFNKAGNLVNQSAYTWGGSADPTNNSTAFHEMQDPGDPLNTLQVMSLDPTDLNNWYPAAVSTSGLPIMVANFSGVLDAQTPGSPSGAKYNIEMDFGLKIGNYALPWENQTALGRMAAAQPYAYNSSYKPNVATSGPEFIALNPRYDPSLSVTADGPNAMQYILNIPGYANLPDETQFPDSGYPDLSDADPTDPYGQAFNNAWLQTLARLRGASTVSFAANSPLAGLTLPDQITISLNTDNIVEDGANTGDATLPAGNTVNLTIGTTEYTGIALSALEATIRNHYNGNPQVTFPVGFDQAALEDAVDNDINRQLTGTTMADKSVFRAASAANANNVAEMSKPVVIDADACTSFNGSFSASQAQDGYGYGDLSSWHVDQEGILYGVYSNGVTLPLWQVTLYDFTAPQGLRREGNNLFSQTRYSGESKSGAAGVSGLGSLNGYSLEGSNVDMSTEFVQMITTQRGFQANSKVVTTTDVMLDTVINMKR